MRPVYFGLALLTMASCAPPAPKKPAEAPAPVKDEEPATTKLATGKVEVLATDEQGKAVIRVRAASSDIEVGKQVGVSQLKTVEGEIYKAGKLESKFRADRGTVDQVKRLIDAKGNVVVKDSDGSVALRADAIHYKDGSGRIEAKGRVTVSSEAWRIGPFADLYATPDLQRVATPDRFP